MPKTDAQKRALKKYDIAHYKTIAAKVNLHDIPKYEQFARLNNLSMNMLIIRAIKYCIVHNIDLHENIEIPENSDGNGADEN